METMHEQKQNTTEKNDQQFLASAHNKEVHGS